MMTKQKLISLLIKKQTYKDTKQIQSDIHRNKTDAINISISAIYHILKDDYNAEAKLYAIRYLKDCFEKGNQLFIGKVQARILPVLVGIVRDSEDGEAVLKYGGSYTKSGDLEKFKSLVVSMFTMSRECIEKWAKWIPDPSRGFVKARDQVAFCKKNPWKDGFVYFREENQILFKENCKKSGVSLGANASSQPDKVIEKQLQKQPAQAPTQPKTEPKTAPKPPQSSTIQQNPSQSSKIQPNASLSQPNPSQSLQSQPSQSQSQSLQPSQPGPPPNHRHKAMNKIESIIRYLQQKVRSGNFISGKEISELDDRINASFNQYIEEASQVDQQFFENKMFQFQTLKKWNQKKSVGQSWSKVQGRSEFINDLQQPQKSNLQSNLQSSLNPPPQAPQSKPQQKQPEKTTKIQITQQKVVVATTTTEVVTTNANANTTNKDKDKDKDKNKDKDKRDNNNSYNSNINAITDINNTLKDTLPDFRVTLDGDKSMIHSKEGFYGKQQREMDENKYNNILPIKNTNVKIAQKQAMTIHPISQQQRVNFSQQQQQQQQQSSYHQYQLNRIAQTPPPIPNKTNTNTINNNNTNNNVSKMNSSGAAGGSKGGRDRDSREGMENTAKFIREEEFGAYDYGVSLNNDKNRNNINASKSNSNNGRNVSQLSNNSNKTPLPPPIAISVPPNPTISQSHNTITNTFPKQSISNSNPSLYSPPPPLPPNIPPPQSKSQSQSQSQSQQLEYLAKRYESETNNLYEKIRKLENELTVMKSKEGGRGYETMGRDGMENRHVVLLKEQLERERNERERVYRELEGLKGEIGRIKERERLRLSRDVSEGGSVISRSVNRSLNDPKPLSYKITRLTPQKPPHEPSSLTPTQSVPPQPPTQPPTPPPRVDQCYLTQSTTYQKISTWLTPQNEQNFKRCVLGIDNKFYEDQYVTIYRLEHLFAEDGGVFLKGSYSWHLRVGVANGGMIRVGYGNIAQVDFWTKPVVRSQQNQQVFTQQTIARLCLTPLKIMKSTLHLSPTHSIPYLLPFMFLNYLKPQQFPLDQFHHIFTTHSPQILKSKVFPISNHITNPVLLKHAVTTGPYLQLCYGEEIGDWVYLVQIQLLRNQKAVVRVLSIPGDGGGRERARELVGNLCYLLS